ncbi:Glutathione s-transferase [Globisporangium polare]
MSPAPYQNYVSTAPDAEFPAEKGRYHLYVTYSCPFACHALSALYLKGLEDVVSVSVAHPIFQKTKPNDPTDSHCGWAFADPAKSTTVTGFDGKEYSTEGCTPDAISNATYVRDIYELVDKEPRAYTVPLLWDTKKHTIVCNESADILRSFNSGFGDLATTKVDLLPEELKSEIEAMNAGLVAEIDAGVLKVMFAPDEDAHQQALTEYFTQKLQAADDLLATSRFLVGNEATESDIRVFHSLVRFDVNQRASDKFNLNQYPNLVNYLRDLYQTPAIKASTKWDHLKHVLTNYHYPVLASGPSFDYEAAHDRATRFAN